MENRGLGRQLINALETGVQVHKLEKIRQDKLCRKSLLV